MKKVFLVIILFFLLHFLNVKSNNYLLDDESYNIYTLSVENLSTNNIINFFSDIDVIRLYPKVNPIYKSMIGNISYKLESSDLLYEVNKFKSEYLSFIKKNSYLDYNYLYTNGINIDKIDVYISDKDLYDIINSGLSVHIIK